MERLKFRRLVDALRGVSAGASQAVTLYVPPGRRLQDAINRVADEVVQCQNIKDRSTRKGVEEALTTLLTRLRTLSVLPLNGLACFVGGGVDVLVEPPEAVQSYLYRCDSEFVLDPLTAMLEEKETYGLIVIDRAEATFGFLRGTHITTVLNVQSNLMGKHGKGGQSQHRFERIMEGETHSWYVRAAEHATQVFLGKPLKGVLIGGPGPTKEYFAKQGYLHYQLLSKVVSPCFSTGYTDEYGIKELAKAAAATLTTLELGKEQAAVQKFLRLTQTTDRATYGTRQVKEAIQQGRVGTLLVSEKLPEAPLLCDLAAKFGTEVTIVSDGTDEGNILAKGYGGCGAILRF